mgnify:CR=1 FL=1
MYKGSGILTSYKEQMSWLEIFKISAKSGLGVNELISKIPDLISSPVTKAENTNALIFDSYFDPYRGVIASVRVFGGEIKTNSKLKLINSKFDFDASEIGYFDINIEIDIT